MTTETSEGSTGEQAASSTASPWSAAATWVVRTASPWRSRSGSRPPSQADNTLHRAPRSAGHAADAASVGLSDATALPQPRPPKQERRSKKIRPALASRQPVIRVEAPTAAALQDGPQGVREDTELASIAGDIVELARESGYSVLFAYDSQLGCHAVDGVERAILVVIDSFHRLPVAKTLLHRVRQELGIHRPVFAILLGGSHPLDQHVAILEACRELICAGASDVILQQDGLDQIKLAIAISLVRETVKEAERRKQNDIFEEQFQSVSNLFWKNVDFIFDSFPPMQPLIDAQPGPGSRVGRLVLQDRLGRGTYGSVYGGIDVETGEMEAVKIISKTELLELDEVSGIWKELRVLRGLKHPNIVAFKGSLHGPRHIFIRMELVGSSNLYLAMRKVGGALSLPVTREFTRQLSGAIAFLSRHKIAHRDLKPENIALADDLQNVKIVDFGSATATGQECTDLAGTMPFMAPEVLACEGRHAYDAMHVDVWALGVVLLEMLCGVGQLSRMLGWRPTLEPSARCAAELRAFFARVPLLQDHGSELEEEGALLTGMLKCSPLERLSPQQVSESHWLQGCLRTRHDPFN